MAHNILVLIESGIIALVVACIGYLARTNGREAFWSWWDSEGFPIWMICFVVVLLVLLT